MSNETLIQLIRDEARACWSEGYCIQNSKETCDMSRVVAAALESLANRMDARVRKDARVMSADEVNLTRW